ncbi:MAG: ATP-binding protein [Candidatus Glassbacteria bacterium]
MNLRAKTSLSISAFIVMLLLTDMYLEIHKTEREQNADLLEDGMRFAELTSPQLSSEYERYYHKAFYTFLSALRKFYTLNDDLYKIEIADANGNILLGTEEVENSSPVKTNDRRISSEWDQKALTSVTPRYRYVKLDGKKLLEISYPVLLQGGVHKHNIFYYYSFDALEERLADIKYGDAKTMFIFIALGFAGASIFSHGLTRNLRHLLDHTVLMAHGDLETPVDVTSKDELGELASSFEYMRNELKKKNEEIESHSRKLEEKVKERTSELEALTVKLKQNNIILQRANEKLLELDRLKSAFLANTSHELRTPLTSIIGYSQCALAELDGPLPEAHKNNLKKILASGKDLLELINRILDFSKIESGTISLHKENFNIKDVIGEAVTTIRPLSEEKGLSLISSLEPDIPAINADRMRIKQALVNLLSNAVKFTEKGFIQVSAIRNNGELQVSVKDTGIGIPKESRDTIFEAFRQVDGSVQRNYGGSGLGLSISKKLIELHRGRIWVDSEDGVGTTFTFTIPVNEEDDSDEKHS